MYCAVLLLELRGEVCAPPEVARGEGEEDLEGADVLQLGNDLVSGALPVLGGPWNPLEHNARVFHLQDDTSSSSHTFFAPHASEIGVGSQPLSLHDRHGGEEEVWRLGKPFIDIEQSLLEIVLLRQLDCPLVTQSKLSIWQEHGPGLDVEVFEVHKVDWFLALPRSKVQIGDLFAFAIEENVGMAVDQSAVLVVVEMLPPHWVVLNVLFLLLHGDLHLIFTFIGVFDCLILHLCQVRSGGHSKIFLDVVFVILEQSQPPLIFDLAPCHVGLLVVVELIVGIV